jgi:uncharacterized protein
MPSSYTYPGVYVEEIPSGVRTIVGVSTSVTAFLGRTARGIANEPKTITSFGDFERDFGGLNAGFPLSYAVRDFFLNGGSLAVIVRLVNTLPVIEALYNAVKAAADADAARKAITDAISNPDNAAAKAKLEAIKKQVDDLPAEPPPTKDDIVTICQTEANKSAKAAAEDITSLKLTAASFGMWGDNLRVSLDKQTDARALQAFNIPEADAFNLTVQQIVDDEVIATDTYSNLTAKDTNHARYVGAVLKRESASVYVPAWEKQDANPATAYDDAIGEVKTAVEAAVEAEANNKFKAAATTKLAELAENPANPIHQAIARSINLKSVKDDADKAAVKAALGKELENIPLTGGSDGEELTPADYLGSEDKKEGIYALADADFNLLCIPPDTFDKDTPDEVYVAAAAYCQKRRAMVIVDPPLSWGKSKSTAVEAAKKGFNELVGELGGPAARYAALYFPRIQQRDPLKNGDIRTFAACGTIAGVMARTDATRGVWKAPAGIDAGMAGTVEPQVLLNDLENGQLNPLGVNVLRNFPVIGNVVWGARTLRGADILADDYKYIPIRRLANYIEESLYRGTKWIVFEPNDEPLWAQIRMNIGAFMQDLFRQGAFQGSTPRDAYLVKCDKETTTQFDIDRGIVNIIVGFAPLKPAEFVVLKIQQLARNQS